MKRPYSQNSNYQGQPWKRFIKKTQSHSGSSDHGSQQQYTSQPNPHSTEGVPFNTLATRLVSMDGKPYPCYKDLPTRFNAPKFTLLIDHIQADPFATASRFRILVEPAAHGFPPELYSTPIRQTALCDYMARAAYRATKTQKVSGPSASSKSGGRGGWHNTVVGGEFDVDAGGQQVLERSAVRMREGVIQFRLTISLPGKGRRIQGHQAKSLLTENLPRIVNTALFHASFDAKHIKSFVDSIDDQEYLRNLLPQHDLIAFVANGAVLPRRS
ncbi:hypothetical protein BJ085DRAFT_40952, partial [Dimargaris cristalligena]